jgi:uncharacterized LabA/DUF88 family protein
MAQTQRPSPCRVHAFIDGQNLFHAVKRAFGYTTPNYDPLRLAQAVAARLADRQLVRVHFYTGVPPQDRSYRWSEFWSAKVRAMKAAGIHVVTRTLRYSPEQIVKADGSVETAMVAREKGIDLRLALDLLRLARAGAFEAALLFSQDGDLAEVVDEIKDLRVEVRRWLVVDCAYPLPTPAPSQWLGIRGASGVPFDKALYDACIDPADYFPPPRPRPLPGME